MQRYHTSSDFEKICYICRIFVVKSQIITPTNVIIDIMTSRIKTLTAVAAALLSAISVNAQDESFDLSSQRSESQIVNPVPGEKIDHKGLVINPVPQEMNFNGSLSLDIKEGFKVKDRKGCFADDLSFLTAGKGGCRLDIDFGEKAARKNGVKMTTGAYVLTVDKKGVKITGYDEKGAFYGIQTLRQILESERVQNAEIPYMCINDWPDLKYRGVVEGFYGEPWSHEVRLSLIDFYGKYKMNCYLYGPKDDPYHSSPDWRLPYPENEARNISELVEACRRNRVDFVWAIHPGKDIRWNEEDYQNLVNKFEMMYDLGVRSFALFFDDINGEGTNPVRQTELVNRLVGDFVEKKGDVTNLIICPTDYSKLWANPGPDGPLSIYGRTLHPSVEIFWTGDVVCSDLTKETMQWLNERIQRPGFYWWNYPVTDYARHILMQGPVYGLNTEMTSDDLCGLVSNPMEHGEASKLALYGVADYTWNVNAYNAIDNWERGLEVLAPEVRDAYRTFAIHSCDTEDGYRRDESWETETFFLDGCTDEKFNALMEEFKKIEQVPATMENCENALLLRELRPWLEEFGKLGTRGRKALECLEIFRSGDNAMFWNTYISNVMSKEDVASYNAHRIGTLKLQPFYENIMNDMAASFYAAVSGKPALNPQALGSYKTLGSTRSRLMFDYDTTTFFTTGDAQMEGHWIGVDLGSVRPVSEVVLFQGKTSSVTDNDYFDHAVIEASADAKTWTALKTFQGQLYEVSWEGEPVQARYVRMRKLESPKTSWTVIRSFLVNPVEGECLASDENPFTSYAMQGSMSFDVPEGTSACHVLMDAHDGTDVTMNVKDAEGNVIMDCVTSAAYAHMLMPVNAATVELCGNAEIFEIIFVR